MKKNVIKTAFAAVCVVAAGMGGLKAYNVSEQSKVDMLLAQNVNALSAGDDEVEYDEAAIRESMDTYADIVKWNFCPYSAQTTCYDAKFTVRNIQSGMTKYYDLPIANRKKQ